MGIYCLVSDRVSAFQRAIGAEIFSRQGAVSSAYTRGLKVRPLLLGATEGKSLHRAVVFAFAFIETSQKAKGEAAKVRNCIKSVKEVGKKGVPLRRAGKTPLVRAWLSYPSACPRGLYPRQEAV